MARPLKIAWKHPGEVFYQLYKQEIDARIAKRWQAVGMLRRGERLKRVKELVGMGHVTVQRWVRWYEAGGIEEVARHRLGSGVRSYEAWTLVQEQRLREAASEGQFRTIGEAVAWCRRELGVAVSYKKLYDWFWRWGYRKKVSRPMAEKADVRAQGGWKGGAIGSPKARGRGGVCG
jgi:transposase